MRVVVTGGAGFLGSHLADRLLADGNEVVAIDNLVTGREENIAHLAERADFAFVRQDVSQPFDVDGDVDLVMHLASPASPKDFATLPIEILQVGSYGTHHALELARTKGARFFLASTSEVYGDPLVHPQTEDYLGNVNTVGPRGVYDESKRFAEALTMAYHRTHGVDTRIGRIFNTYGPRMRLDDGRVLPNFMRQALTGEPLTVYGDGSQTRSFCYCTDLIEGFVRLVSKDADVPTIHHPVNLGNPVESTILDFARKVIETAGSASEIAYRDLPKDDPKVRCPEVTRVRGLLDDWTPEVTLDDGLVRTMHYFREALGL